MKRCYSKLVLVAVSGVVFGLIAEPVRAQQTGLLADLFSGKSSSSKGNSKSKKPTKSSTSKTKKSTSSSKEKVDLLTALSGKTPEERAKAAAARKKAADAKAREDARKKALAAEEKKKADLAKAKEDARKAAIAAAAKKKKEEEKAREAAARAKQLAEKKRADEARKRALAEEKLKEERARELLAMAREKEEARRKAEEQKLAEQRRRDADLIAQARGRKPRGGGLFGNRFRTSSEATSIRMPAVASPPNRYLYINEREVSRLNPANSRIEIHLGDQRAKVFNGSTLVIETQISSGKPGFRTPTGRYSVKEKLVDKQSGRYGTWYNSSGMELKGDDKHNPPPGASRFVGADMPYWMRLTGGIGMHIGYVPDGAASHGCVRVPSNIQPLIFSKVKVGTPVTIR